MHTRIAAITAGLSLAAASVLVATSGPAAAAASAGNGAVTTATTATATATATTTATGTTTAVPKLSHIMEVFLENETATATFEDPADNPQLAALEKQGSYVPDFHGSGHASLDNYLADFSGEQPDAATEADCAGMAPDGGCLYPASVPTLATTLDSAGHSWKIYSEGEKTAALLTGNTTGACLHSPSLSVPDIYQGPGTNGYATRHNPAAWFDSVLTKGGSEAYCQAHDVDLTNLTTDEQSSTTLPTWSFIEPDTCHDGHDNTTGTSGGCAADPEGPTAPSGTEAIDAWLPGFVNSVMTSPGWDANSVMVITFDEAATADTSGCTVCRDTSAGGRIGALFLGAPVKKGYTSTWQGDHYGLLRTVEASLGLPTLKSLAATPAAATTVHDGDPGVTPVTDIWAASAGAPALAGTTSSSTSSSASTTSANKSTGKAAKSSTKKTAAGKQSLKAGKATRSVSAVSKPSVTKPSVSKPSETQPSVTQPSVTLAYTGLPVALGLFAVVLLAFGFGGSRLLRRGN